MAKTLTLIPSQTKYARVELQGITYEVWAVNPVTGKPGTDIPYTEAVRLLQLQPPVVAVLPQVKDGKFVSGLTERDAKAIAEAQQSANNYGTLISKAAPAPAPVTEKETEDTSYDERLAELEAKEAEYARRLAELEAKEAELAKAAESETTANPDETTKPADAGDETENK